MSESLNSNTQLASNMVTTEHSNTMSRRELLAKGTVLTGMAVVAPGAYDSAQAQGTSNASSNQSRIRIAVQELTREAFYPFGSYAQMLNPDTIKFGEEPIEFYRDMAQADLGATAKASYSVCRVVRRAPVIDMVEQHSQCAEVMLPLDGDVVVQVGPATPNGVVPYERLEAFRVPQGTLITLNPGVWHYAPFAITAECVNILIVLPERTYANDCEVVVLEPAQHVVIDGI